MNIISRVTSVQSIKSAKLFDNNGQLSDTTKVYYISRADNCLAPVYWKLPLQDTAIGNRQSESVR